jgi:phosphatidylserine decarboxylase
MVIGIFINDWLAVLGFCLGLFCLFFFRDPVRVPPPRPGAILAPADGRVVSVAPGVPPAELGLGPASRWRISIFLSVLNVHVNRVPVAGTVTRIAYRHGAFLNASLDKASDANERNAIALRLPDGRELAVVQIAGLIARRILCSLREGDAVRGGDRLGIIRFGSRTDLYLPEDVQPLVCEGQTMIGGETVVAQFQP